MHDEDCELFSYRYVPYPGGGEKWGGNGIGDDLYSYGFDGASLWMGKNLVLSLHHIPLMFNQCVIVRSKVRQNN